MSGTTVVDESQSVNDVLASIRKLVSEEAHARTIEAEKVKAAADPDNLLVLTPELKVAKNEPEEPLVLITPAVEPATATLHLGPAQETVRDVRTPEQEHTTPAQVEDAPAAPFQDEVALRALVSEMIREEFQGELGSRITRNIRKLIRQEINVALKKQT